MIRNIAEYHRSRLLLGAVLLAMTLLPACVPTVPVGVNFGKETLKVIQTAVDNINHQPDQWQDVLTNTNKQLEQLESQSAQDAKKLATQAAEAAHKLVQDTADITQALVTRSIGQVGAETRCGADFIGNRVSQRLQEIRYGLQVKLLEPNPTPVTVAPVVCTNEPDNVQVGKTTLLRFYGYDFLEFEKSSHFESVLQYAGGSAIRTGAGNLAVENNYLMVLDISTMNITGIDRNRGVQLALKWGDQTVNQSVLPVQFPQPRVLGGIDLDDYCRQIGYAGTMLSGSNFYCGVGGKPIAIIYSASYTGICQRQYGDPTAYAQTTDVNDPTAYWCFAP